MVKNGEFGGKKISIIQIKGTKSVPSLSLCHSKSVFVHVSLDVGQSGCRPSVGLPKRQRGSPYTVVTGESSTSCRHMIEMSPLWSLECDSDKQMLGFLSGWTPNNCRCWKFAGIIRYFCVVLRNALFRMMKAKVLFCFHFISIVEHSKR